MMSMAMDQCFVYDRTIAYVIGINFRDENAMDSHIVSISALAIRKDFRVLKTCELFLVRYHLVQRNPVFDSS